MSGYVKKIAVIKQLKSGFSADGGAVSGLVKAEAYAGFFKVEVSLLNFAPLTEGRYVFGITDGSCTVVFEDVRFEGECAVKLEEGFAFLVCFCRGGEAFIVAGASCGGAASASADLAEELIRREKAATGEKSDGAAYDDEAISEVNYYENQAVENGGAIYENKGEKEAGERREEDEASSRPRQGEGGVKGGYYFRMKGDIDKIFSVCPRERCLEEAFPESEFAKIFYGDEDKYYVFGVLFKGGMPLYICYGVPAEGDCPPAGFKGLSSRVCTSEGAYWLIYQDATTGVSVSPAT